MSEYSHNLYDFEVSSFKGAVKKFHENISSQKLELYSEVSSIHSLQRELL